MGDFLFVATLANSLGRSNHFNFSRIESRSRFAHRLGDGGYSDGGYSDGGCSDGGCSDGGYSDGGYSDGGCSRSLKLYLTIRRSAHLFDHVFHLL